MNGTANSESMLQTARAYSGAPEASEPASEGVFLLDADGPVTLAPLGWRGRPLAFLPETDEPIALARAASGAIGVALEFHSVVQMQGRKWFVLRPLTRRER
jgi:hypothetical protein